ncbi:TetR family transcriptional regulator [Nitratireductor indicus C115]|uniref:TetR family transcriptional regulator n=1 Tax=Nitratireductor indicus C115 TaxID=1231190 RepID=K2NZD2_9HYPH|nr:TetR/AcrR family transcriptional regulator [Nitratireductor indicus]EKF43279.1 TetR family transcriptional regulator [Nitratireductor indicus C115]SFQ54333.1 transcriptional regulator, TetR family [Nitratireductor indicus]
MPRDAGRTRETIVKAASRLFYGAGIRAVSVDAVAEKAGVTKKTLYYHFRSKDDLVAAYLASRDQPNLELFAKWFAEADGTLADRIGAIFENIAAGAANRRWKGCGFLRTAAELVETPGHPAVKRAAAHKKRLEAWLTEVIAVEKPHDAPLLARHVVLLLDGAFSTMLVHHDVSYIRSAGEAAEQLLRSSAE